jgi:hypothetical protein
MNNPNPEDRQHLYQEQPEPKGCIVSQFSIATGFLVELGTFVIQDVGIMTCSDSREVEYIPSVENCSAFVINLAARR